MPVVTRTPLETGVKISFSVKHWPARRDRIDATRYVPDKEFPGRCEVETNFVRRVPRWDARHPLLRNAKVLGSQLWQDPRDPSYVAGFMALPSEHRSDAKGLGKRFIQQEIVVWKGRHWYHRGNVGWVTSATRIDTTVTNT